MCRLLYVCEDSERNGPKQCSYVGSCVRMVFQSVMVSLHGGGHIVGARSQEFGVVGLFAHHLRHKKLAVVNMRQRLAPEFTADQRVTDVTSVVHHLMDHEGFEAGQIVLYGSSAGGTMALMTAFALLSEGESTYFYFSLFTASLSENRAGAISA